MPMTRQQRLDWYVGYLQSPWWKQRRQRALFLAQWLCQSPLCECKANWSVRDRNDYGGRRLHVHHLTYERVGEELDDDLIVLCDDCHAQIHGLVPLDDSPYLWREYRLWLAKQQRKIA